MSGSNCWFFTHIQVSHETGKVVWYSHLFENLAQFVVTHIVKGFTIANEAEVYVFSGIPWFLYDLANVDNLISGSSVSSKPILYIWKFSVHVLKPNLKEFEHNLISMWNESSCMVIWTFFGIAFLWDWNENWLFSPVTTTEFSKFAGILSAAL